MSTTSGRRSHDGAHRGTSRKAWLAWVLVPAGLLLVAAATAHLVYVAVRVAAGLRRAIRNTSDGNGYRAAKSAC